MFKHRQILFILIAILVMLLVAACQGAGDPKDDPAAAYWAYYEACQKGSYVTAKSFLTPAAQESVAGSSACGFTHDAVNNIERLPDGSLRTFSTDPEVTVEGNDAVMIWIDDQGNVAYLLLQRLEDGWKVDQIVWSK